MANVLNSNPIYLDTFTSAIDLGQSIYGDTNALFFVESIDWHEPTSTSHTAVVKDGKGTVIFTAKCTTVGQIISKKFSGAAIPGIKIDSGAVGSGKILILLATTP